MSLYEINAAMHHYSIVKGGKPAMTEDRFEDKLSDLHALNLPWVKK